MAAGWLIPSAIYVIGVFVTRSGIESALALAFWTGLFVLAAWLLIALPVALFVSPQHFLFRKPVAPIFGAIAGFASMSWTVGGGADGWLLAGYALLVGALAGGIYASIVPRTA